MDQHRNDEPVDHQHADSDPQPDDAWRSEIDLAVHRADLDQLIRLIDRLCQEQEFEALLSLRHAALYAIGTGRQLWPVATLADYRLALLAPAEIAVAVLDDAGRFTLGPLSEVVAQNHTWEDLEPHLGSTPIACSIAHERALRDDTIDAESRSRLPPALDIDAVLHDWEPAYPLAIYRPDSAEFPTPPMPAANSTHRVTLPATRAEVLEDDDVRLAIEQLVDAWVRDSNGNCETTCVIGDASDALGALGLRRARLVGITGAEALAHLAWAGASGGAHGRRRGMALGRYGAWWTVAALLGEIDDWPLDPAVIGAGLDGFDWWWWDADEPLTGWNLNLVVSERCADDERLSWAIRAADGV
jgi:hypothetical protein